MGAIIILIAYCVWFCWELDRETEYCSLFVFENGDGHRFYIAAPTEKKAVRFTAKMFCEKRRAIRREYTIELVPEHEWLGLKIEYLRFGKYPDVTNVWEEMYHGKLLETRLIATNIID